MKLAIPRLGTNQTAYMHAKLHGVYVIRTDIHSGVRTTPNKCPISRIRVLGSHIRDSAHHQFSIHTEPLPKFALCES